MAIRLNSNCITNYMKVCEGVDKAKTRGIIGFMLQDMMARKMAYDVTLADPMYAKMLLKFLCYEVTLIFHMN